MFLNSSRVSTFVGLCRRRFFFSHLFKGYGLQPEVPNDALNMGIAVHEGLAVWYRTRDRNLAVAATHDTYITRAGAKWGEVVLDAFAEQAEFAGRIVKTYIERSNPADDFTILGVEEDFIVPLGEVCHACGDKYGFTSYDEQAPVLNCGSCGAEVHYWIGRTDLDVVRDGHVQIVDHKTTKSTPSDDFLAGFGRSFQLLGYVYGKSKAMAYDIRQFGVNALQKAKTIGLPQSEIKTCTSCRNGKHKRVGCKECRGTGKVSKEIKLQPFRRKWFSVNPSDVDRFMLWALRAVRDIAHEGEISVQEPEAAWPMNDKACKMGPCPFIPLCWDNKDAVNWYDPPEELLEGLAPRPADYVNLHEIAVEELG